MPDRAASVAVLLNAGGADGARRRIRRGGYLTRDAARRALSQLAMPSPGGGWESLTATERGVSLLVAGGLTNGAVARRLYISPHTVNTHLRHVFASWAYRTRAALAAVAHHSIK